MHRCCACTCWQVALLCDPDRGEALADTVERDNRIRAMRWECKRLETRLKKETQFNRKVEINAELHRSRADLANLEGAKDLSTQS